MCGQRFGKGRTATSLTFVKVDANGVDRNQRGSFLREARRIKWNLRDVETHGYALGSKKEGHCWFWFKNFDRITVNPWQHDSTNRIRKEGHHIGVGRIGGVNMHTNWLMIRAGHRL